MTGAQWDKLEALERRFWRLLFDRYPEFEAHADFVEHAGQNLLMVKFPSPAGEGAGPLWITVESDREAYEATLGFGDWWHDHYSLGEHHESGLDPSVDMFWDTLAGILAEELVTVCWYGGGEFRAASLRAIDGLDMAAAVQGWTTADRIRLCSWRGTHDMVVPIPSKVSRKERRG